MSTKRRRAAILIPAYNEAAVIGDVLKSIPARIDNYDIDVVVVDDGSSDGTSAIAMRHNAYVLRHMLNSGAGAATATGLQYVRDKAYDAAVTMDADGQHLMDDCKRVLLEIENKKADLVIGSRLINADGMPRRRIIGNKGLNFVTYLIFRTTASDTQSGLKAFSKHALQQINIKASGMEFCSEIIWRAKQSGLVVEETPITALYSDYSLKKGQTEWNGIVIVKNLIKRKLLEFISA